MLNSINTHKQKEFFDDEGHQYPFEKIISPPIHTQLELQKVIGYLSHCQKDWVVDFGAGSGRLTIELLKNKFRVIAVDVSQKSLLRLKTISNELNLPAARLAKTIPEDCQIGAIAGTDILHHIDLNIYLPLFYKRLCRGGRVVFSEPGGLNISWYVYLNFYNWEIERGVTNCTYWNLRRLFVKHGFRHIQIFGLGLLPRPFFNWSRMICDWHDRVGNLPIIKVFAYRYIITAEK